MTDQPALGPCEAIPYRHPNCGGRITSYTIEIPETDETDDTVVGEVYGPGEQSADMEAYAQLFAAAPATAAERDRLKEVNERLVAALEKIAQIQRNKCENASAEILFMLLDNKVDIARGALAEARK